MEAKELLSQADKVILAAIEQNNAKWLECIPATMPKVSKQDPHSEFIRGYNMAILDLRSYAKQAGLIKDQEVGK